MGPRGGGRKDKDDPQRRWGSHADHEQRAELRGRNREPSLLGDLADAPCVGIFAGLELAPNPVPELSVRRVLPAEEQDAVSVTEKAQGPQ